MRLLNFALISLLVLSIFIPIGANAQANPIIRIVQQDEYDQYGHLERNLDGTYYPGDRIAFFWYIDGPIPDPDGYGTHLKVTISSNIQIIERGNGYVIAQFTPNYSGYGEHKTEITVAVNTNKQGIDIMYNQVQFISRLVPYNPTIEAFPYTVMGDSKQHSYQDRTGIVVKYMGSIGNGDNNPFTDNTIFPQRRLMLNDTSNYSSWSNNTEFRMQQIPVNVNGTQGSIPTGIHYVIHKDVLDIKRQGNDRYIFMDQAGYSRNYYFTVPKNNTLVNDAVDLGISVHLEWPPIGFDKRVDYNLPIPRASLANNLTVTTNPAKETTIIVSEEQFKPDRGTYETIKRFAYDQVMKKENDVVMANIVSEDMPDDYVAALSQGNVNIHVPKFHVYIPEYVGNDYNFTNIADYPSVLTMTATVSDRTYTKNFPNYNYEADYKVDIDSRQNLPLDISRSLNGNANIKAPWEVTGLEGATMISCLNENCVINPYSNQVKASNEFGGTAIAQVPPIPTQESPFTQKVEDNLKYVLIVLAVIFGGIWILKKYASFLNRTISG